MKWEYDTAHSYIGFISKHLGINTVHGSFQDAEVTLDMDAEDPAKWSMNATVQAASLNTGVQRRDDHLRSDVYLDVAQHPTISFETKRVERKGSHFALIGALTLHGVTRDVELEVAFNGEATDRDLLKRGFSAQGAINRFDFGIGEPKATWTVGEEIRFVFNMEAVRR